MISASPQWRLFGALGVLLALAPGSAVWAELQVHVARSQVGVYEPLGITVTDPRGGEAASQHLVSVTMADARDRRQTIQLSPTGKPGQWSGYFTPLTTGRFTGTAVLERDHAVEIGLVPRVQVIPSSRPGFIRLHPSSKRVLRYASGPALFPIGVALTAGDLEMVADWNTFVSRARGRGLNYVEVPVHLDAEPSRSTLRAVDALLAAAERNRRLAVQIRLVPPAALDEGQQEALEHLVRCVRRWSYSPALAVWHLDLPQQDSSAEARVRWVRAVRQADPYRHLLALPVESTGERIAAAAPDLWIGPPSSPSADGRPLLLEIRTSAELQSADFWRYLPEGRLGMPLIPLRFPLDQAEPLLARLQQAAAIAGRVPFHGNAQPIPQHSTRTAIGSWRRFGPVYLGQTAGDGDRVTLPVLPRGRYSLRVWDLEGNNAPLDRVLWSDGTNAISTSTELPATACLLVERAASASTPAQPRRKAAPVRPSRPARTLRKPSASQPRRKVAPAPRRSRTPRRSSTPVALPAPAMLARRLHAASLLLG